MISIGHICEWLNCGCIMSCGGGKVFLGWGRRRWMADPCLATQEEVFYFPDFFLRDPTPWFEHEFQQEVQVEELLELLISENKEKYIWKCHHSIDFKAAFEDLQEKIASNVIDKAVPFVFETAQSMMTNTQLCQSLANMIKEKLQYPMHLYGFWGLGEGVLGITPEVLFRYSSEGILETMACAGTIRTEEASAILMNPKELLEHNLVIEGICTALSSFGKVDVGTTGLLSLPKLTHLVTRITAALRSPNFGKIVAALHPTPALGGAPRPAAMRWLEGYHKKIDRMRCGAPAGYLRPTEGIGCSYVAIRNAQWNKKGIFIGAGCGVVAGSRYEKEWDEINLKLQATKELLAL